MRNYFPPAVNKAFYIVDMLVIIISMAFSWWYKTVSDSVFLRDTYLDYLVILLGILPVYLAIYYAFDLYTSKRGQSFNDEMAKIVKANLFGFILLLGLLFALKLFYVSRAVILQFAVANTLLTIAVRYAVRTALRYVRAKGYNQRYLLIIGAGPLGREFYRRLERHKEFGYRVRGFLDDDAAKHGVRIGKTRVAGSTENLEEYLQQNHIDEVVIALPLAAYEKLHSIIDVCERYGIKTLIIPDYYKYLPSRPKVTELDGMPLINIRDIPLDVHINKVLKRGFDIAGSLILIILFSPVMLLVAIGVKLSSPGPVIFRQKRVGLNRRLFDMYKFRSMRVTSEETANTVWTTANDPRRTKFGEFIRATSLDELPQFFNVLKGDMSLVGPRPERPHFVEKFKEEIPKYMVKHQVKPGITGWAQVNGWRGDTSIAERIKCDLYYIENWSLLLDLKIMLLTAFKGFVNKNAY